MAAYNASASIVYLSYQILIITSRSSIIWVTIVVQGVCHFRNVAAVGWALVLTLKRSVHCGDDCLNECYEQFCAVPGDGGG